MSDLYETLKDHLTREKGIATATVVRGSDHIGAKMLIFPDAKTQGTLGSAQLDDSVARDAEGAIWTGDARIRKYGFASRLIAHSYNKKVELIDSDGTVLPVSSEATDGEDTETIVDASASYEVFIEGFPPPPALIIVGAGHIAIPLTTFAKTLNYRVVVVDARAAFATRERFPHADELIVEWPDEVLEKMDLNPASSVAVLTHDPKFDEPTLRVVLSRRVGYVGAIGSRKTSEERAERLKQAGLTEEQIGRIHGPIGLNLGAASPEEMALAIMAEIVASRHGKDSKGILDWAKK